MTAYFVAIVAGLAIGSIYSLVALGLVLTYKTSGLFNFGHGAIAALGAFVFYEAREVHHLNVWLSAGFAVLVFGPIAGFVLELLSRALATAPTAYRIVATLGLLIAVQAAATLRYGAVPKTVKPYFPDGDVTVASVVIGYNQLITAGVGLLGAVVLVLFFRASRTGRATRAVVDDAQLLDMTGVSPARVRRVSWSIGCSFASASGVLIAPLLNLDPTLLTLLVVQAFGAAAIGQFSNLFRTYIGGLVVGVAAAIVNKQVVSYPALSGLADAVPFLILFVVLLVTPRSMLAEVGRTVRRPQRGRPQKSTKTAFLGVGAMVVLSSVPFVVGSKLPLWTQFLAQATLLLSLALLVRTSGQVSLCHVGFSAVGAATFAHLAGEQHLPWVFAVALAGLATVPFGLIVAVPAIRLSGLFLALATFGFGLLLSGVVYRLPVMFGNSGDSLHAPRPHGLTGDRSWYFVLLAFLVVGVGVIRLVEKSRLGRLLRALADSPAVLSTHGAEVNVTRVLVFALSALMAGVAGALLAANATNVGTDDFQALNSLTLLVVLVLATQAGTVGSALVASALLFVVPGYIESPQVGSYLSLGFGLAAMLAAVLNGPGLVLRRPARRRPDAPGPVEARATLRRAERSKAALL